MKNGGAVKMVSFGVSLTLASLWVVTFVAAASADEYELGGDRLDRGSGAAEVEIEVPESVSELVEDVSGETGREWVMFPKVGNYHDEETGSTYSCRLIGWHELMPDEDRDEVLRQREQEYAAAQENVFFPGINLEDPYAPCPSESVEELPEVVVEHAVRRVALAQLPRPEPSVPPGFALTGLPAYLVTGHGLSFGPFSQTLDLGITSPSVTFTAVGSTTVDWGDGTVTEHGVAGLPYPDGEVVHTYTDRDAVSIEVVDRWTVTYDVGGTISGTLVATLDPVTIDDLPVHEYRTVRVSPDR